MVDSASYAGKNLFFLCLTKLGVGDRADYVAHKMSADVVPIIATIPVRLRSICPTGPFSNLEPHNPLIEVFKLRQICRSTDFEALYW